MKLPNFRTIVAEDDVALARLLVHHLEALGLTVVGQAHDGEEAVLLARSLEPDLVILDLKMPRRNGLQAAQEILSERFIPVILLTGHVEAAFVEKAAELGIMGYLTKPFDARSLYASISVALAQHAQIRVLQDEAGSLREALETRKLVERAKGILMDSFGIAEESAMSRLREESRNRNLKLGEVARSLIQAHETLTGIGRSPRQPKS